MSVSTSAVAVGDLLRDWRQRRRLSQLDLAVEAEVSVRHLSFVETGRSRPSREMVVGLAESLDLPLRDRNALLLAAGYAPIYHETALDDAAMSPVRGALDRLLAGHEPFPAIVVDRHWELVAANRPAMEIMSDGVAPQLLEPPVNAMRVTLHPEGMAPRIVNFAEYSSHLIEQLHRQATSTGDPVLLELERELRGYAGLDGKAGSITESRALFVPMVLRISDNLDLTFFNTLTTFGTALDITMAELTIEALYPADAATAAAVRAAWG